MEEDEDVVFEGSAIYKHLQDTGYTDFEFTQLRTSYCQEETTKNDSCKDKKNVLELLREKWFCLRSTILGKWVPEYVAYKEIAEFVAQSKLVNDDDWLVLEHFMPGGEELHHSGFLTGPKASVYKILFFFGISSIILLVLQLLCVASETWCIYIVTFLLTLPISLILGQIAAFVRYIIFIHHVKIFVLLLRETSQIASKSVRLLLEVDLITKGFVLAQGSSFNSFCENSESPQCSRLSSSLSSSLNSLAQVLHLNHKYLEKFSPQYFCMRQLFDNVDMPASKEGGNDTEFTFLKKWVAITKLQLSAVLTELLLCIHEPVLLDRLCAACNTLFTCSQVSVLRRETKSLTKHLEYTKAFWLHDRQEEIKFISLEEKKKNVYIAIHSLSLHMQAALFRLQGLENRFESENTSADYSQDLEWNKCEALPAYEYVKEQLSAIKIELDSCQGCIEEAAVRVDRKYGINNSEINPKSEHLNVSDIQEENTSPEVAKKATIVLYDMEEPVVEDEVFEAFIDKEFCDRQREDTDDDSWNADVRKERQMLKHQKEQGKRVLNELQPILMKRRKMWEQREDIALNRQLAKQAVDDDILQTTEQKHMSPSLKREQVLENLSKDIYDDKLDICGQVRMEIQKKNTSSFDENISESCSDSPKLKNLSTSDSPEEEEVDSDEERLEVYRKLKMELDEDEMSRLREDVEKDRKFQEEGECIFSLPVSHEISLHSNNHFEQKYDSEMQHYQDDVEDTRNRVSNMDVNPLSSFKCSAMKYDTVVGDLSKEGASASIRDEGDKVSDSERILSISELDKEVQIVKEEVFVHNEEAGEEKSPHIDWNITFPVRQIETLGDRMQLFSAGQNIGFQAGIAAEAQAASKRFWTTASNSTEIFGGVGEGEEIFGSDDDDNDDDDEEGKK